MSIDAGGGATGPFLADRFFSGGSTFSTSSDIDTSLLTGDVPPTSVLQTERYGEFTYTIPNRTPGTPQTVTLYFAETYWTAAGQRTFDVTLNGKSALTAFDIYAAAGGPNRAIARTFTTTADSSGRVVIQFLKNGADNPKVCALTVAGSGEVPAPIAGSCPARPGAPPGVGPLPSPAQVAYQRTELTAFIHLGLATFDGTEQGSGTDSPSLFDPSNLDVSQWVSTLQAAGFRQATLTAKHSTGFCLWPSAYTDYSVKSSPWMNGKGDVVRLFTDAMHAAGMRVGFYLAPWDQHFDSGAHDAPGSAYETYLKNQLTELLTQYGPVYEIWFDGAWSPTKLDWKSVYQLAKQLQPDVLVWAGPELAATGVDLRWIGSESGHAARGVSSVGSVPNGGPSDVWYPWETNVSDRVPNWFWHPGDRVMSLADMQSVYFESVGVNTTLIFNVPPSTAGVFDTPDVRLLQQFGDWYRSLYQNNRLAGQAVSADSTWAAGFDGANAVDADVCTYWAAARGKTAGRLEVSLPSPAAITLISIREPIELGERATAYHVELKQNGTWNRSPTDASGIRIQGSVIGQRQLWRLQPTTVEAVALVIDSAKDVPAIAEFGVY